MLALAAYPLRSYFYARLPPANTDHGISRLDMIHVPNIFTLSPPLVALLLLTFFLTNAITDFFSFAKSRTLITIFPGLRTPIRLVLIVVLDIASSLVIAFFISTYVSLVPAAILTIKDKALYGTPALAISIALTWRYRKSVGSLKLVLNNVLFLALVIFLLYVFYVPAPTYPTPMQQIYFDVPGAFHFAAFSSLGISTAALLALVIELVKRGVQRIEARRIWSGLDFDRNPARAAAIIVISVFTAIYWPAVLIVDFIPVDFLSPGNSDD